MLKYEVQLAFPATKNEAEYEEELTGLMVRKELGARNLLLQSDSKLIVGQIKGEFKVKEERIKKYLKLTKLLMQEFDRVEFAWIPRSKNMGVEELAKQSLSEARPISIDLKIEVQRCPSIEEVHTFAIQSRRDWITPIISFLQDGQLPPNVEKVRNIRKRATRFTILNDTLYERGFSMPYLRCISEEEAKYKSRGDP